MEEKNRSGKGIKFLTEKGFYIVLFICAAVIGVCAWLLWSNFVNTEEDSVTVSDSIISRHEPVFSNENDMESTDDVIVTENEALPETDTSTVEEEFDTVTVGTWDDTDTETEEADILEAPSEEVSAPSPDEMPTMWPVSGEVVYNYSVDALSYNKTMSDWRTHDGIDVSAELGTKVRAMGAGTVTALYEDEMLGTTVVIDHGNGLESVYANLAATPVVSVGDTVSMGDVIGSVGNTALGEVAEVSHLHLAVYLNGESEDPTLYLN